MINVEDVKRDVKINRFKLEEESEKQPSLYFYYANELAELKGKKDKMENKLNLILAEVELSIREKPPEKIKITESVIKSLVEKNKKVIEIKKRLAEIKEEIYVYSAVVSALEQRNSQLKVLKDLFLANYFTVDNDKRTFQGSQEARKRLNKKHNDEEEEL